MSGPSSSGEPVGRAGHARRRAQRRLDHARATSPAPPPAAPAGSRAVRQAAPRRSGTPRADAVARVAATVIATPSARPRTERRARRRATARVARPGGSSPGAREGGAERSAQHEDPGDGGERELPAGVGAHARVQRERRRRGEQQGIPARRRPRERHRRDPRGAHHAGALERRARAGQRHVQRHEREERGAAAPGPGPPSASSGTASATRSITFWPLTASRCAEARVAPVLSRGLVDLLVLAEHHAAGERGLGRRAGRPRRPAPRACAWNRAGRPRRRAGGRSPAPGRARARPRCRGGGGKRRSPKPAPGSRACATRPLTASSAPTSMPAGSRVQRGTRSRSRTPRSRPETTAISGGAERGRPRGAERRCTRSSRTVTVANTPGGRLERPQPRVPDAAPRARGQRRWRRRSGIARACTERDRRELSTAAPRAIATASVTAGRAARRAARPRALPRDGTWRGVSTSAVAHGCSASRSVARRFSPMPSTSASSSSEPEAAVGVAVLDDALRERRADAVDLVELLRGRRREVDLRAGRRSGRSSRAGGGLAPPAPARRSAGRPGPAPRGSRA